MLCALRAAIFPGLLAIGGVLFASAQVTAPQALPQPQQTDKAAEGVQPEAAGGVNTGAPHPAQLDEHRRPITAGGFVASGPVVFEDASDRKSTRLNSSH